MYYIKWRWPWTLFYFYFYYTLFHILTLATAHLQWWEKRKLMDEKCTIIFKWALPPHWENGSTKHKLGPVHAYLFSFGCVFLSPFSRTAGTTFLESTMHRLLLRPRFSKCCFRCPNLANQPKENCVFKKFHNSTYRLRVVQYPRKKAGFCILLNKNIYVWMGLSLFEWVKWIKFIQTSLLLRGFTNNEHFKTYEISIYFLMKQFV